ncbi:type II secretion system protein [Dielma fastidiosa]|uniref:type II secretion system protein n=1 Tax=Dielma fastidiosa TaxID=1034346 RepID=UPI000E522E15|nr:type II secretion system protein [Dielma fastidiosa]RHN02708.1 type II secretion system protein [Dielma fastidiosa]
MKNKKGFTLIELIVVIAILGILALFLVPQFMGYANDAKMQVARANTRTVWSAAKAVEVSYQYKYTEFDEAVFKADVMDKLGTSFDADEVSVAFDHNYMVSDVAYKTGDYTCETTNGTDFVCTDQ